MNKFTSLELCLLACAACLPGRADETAARPNSAAAERLDGNKSAIELDWSFPLAGQIKGFVQYFCGYGETLLDYNELDQRLGVGFLLADWI